MRRMARRFALPFALLVSRAVCAMHPAVRNYTTRDGLPQAQVSAILQDRQGYLWVGTVAGGLARYDGRNWDVFDASSGMPANGVSCLTMDAFNNLFVGTNGGTVTVRRGVASPFPTKTPLRTAVNTMLAEGQNLWIGTIDGLFLWDEAKEELHLLAAPPGWKRANVRALAVGENGEIWVGLMEGLARVGREPAIHLEAVAGLPSGNVRSLLVRPGKPLLVSVSDSGLFEWDGKTALRVGNDQMPGRRIACLLSERDVPGGVWIGTQDSGAFHWRSGVFEPFRKSDGLLDKNVYSIYQDREGVIWFGTEAGLTKRGRSAFLTLDSSDGVPAGQPVYSMAESRDGAIWFATTDSGLVRVDSGGKIRDFFTEQDGPPESQISDVKADPRGGVWVLTNRSLARIEGDRVTRIPTPMPARLIRTILTLHDGRLLAGTFTEGVFELVKNRLTPMQGPFGREITAMFEQSDGTIWVGGDGWGAIGMHRFGPPTFLNRSNGLPSNYVNHVFVDSRGVLWISTDRGVWRKDPSGGATVYSRSSGLPDSFIYWTGEDRAGNIWFGTNHGAVRRRTGGTMETYLASDGLASDECNESGFLADSKGRVFIATRGVSLFQGSPRPSHPLDPPVVIEWIHVGGHDLAEYQHGVLPHAPGAITFHYAALTFLDESAVRFRYRLLGLSDTWTDSRPGQSETTYGGLAPGDYRFEVAALTGDGRVSRVAAAEFLIHEIWWKRPLALAGEVILLLGIVIGFIRARERQLTRARLHLESLIEERTEELRHVNDRLASLVVTDDLTKLPNRRHILDELSSAIAFSRRQGTPLSIAIGDLDHFKRVNDVLGHAEGDRFLRLAGLAMRQVLRSEDLVGRYGGEEFLAIMPGSDAAGVAAAGERMRTAIPEIPFQGIEKVFGGSRASISIGLATLLPSDTQADLIQRADRALYRAKAEGRDRVVLADESDSRPA